MDDEDPRTAHPLPIATLSATLHEAIVIADKRSESMSRQIVDTPSSKSWDDLPLPFYRKMSIVCFDPADPSSSFHGGWTAPLDSGENDVGQLNWDRETVQTDGIVCISSSMSGAAQLCLPVSRTRQPITPSSDIKSAVQSELQSNSGSVTSHIIESLPALDLPKDPDTLSTTSTRSHADAMEFSTGHYPLSTPMNKHLDEFHRIPSGSMHSHSSHVRIETE